MNNRLVVLLAVLSFVSGGALVWHFRSPEKITTTETQTIVQVVHEHINPDGSKDITTISRSKDDKKIVDVKAALVPQWHVGLGLGHILGSAQLPDYNLSVSRRVLGPFFLGVFGSTSGYLGAQVIMEF